MIANYAKIIQVISEANGVVGRKKLQKMIYIAKKLDLPFEEKFTFHFYGPYSEELTLRVDELVALGFLHEMVEDKGNYIQYHYEATDSGKVLLANPRNTLSNSESLVMKMNEESSRFLELVSTVMYFGDLEKEEVKEKIFTLKAKQKYTDEEIDKAYEYIVQLQKLV